MSAASMDVTFTNPFYGSSVELSGPQLLKCIVTIQEFLNLFPPGKMEEWIWELACRVLEKPPGEELSQAEHVNVYGMYQLLMRLCYAMQYMAAKLGPLVKPQPAT